MNIPLPENVDFLAKALAWALGAVLSGLFGLLILMVKQFLTKQDSIQVAMLQLELSVKKDLKDFNDKLLQTAKEMASSSNEISKDANQIREENLAFQQRITDDLMNIKKETLEIEASIGKTHEKAEELEAKFDRTATKIDELYRHIELHDKAMASAASVINEHKAALARSKADMMRVKKKVSALTLIKKSTKSAKSA